MNLSLMKTNMRENRIKSCNDSIVIREIYCKRWQNGLKYVLRTNGTDRQKKCVES